MGAQLWYHVGPWRKDPAQSLKQVQVRHLREAFDYQALLTQNLISTREALRRTSRDDPFDLRDFYEAEVARLEQLSALPPPATPGEEIERLRTLCATSGEGIGCVLDVTHVSEAGGMHVARCLSVTEVCRLSGFERPTTVAAGRAVGRINGELGRGESVCFRIYDESGVPCGWYFVGNTID